MDRPWTYQLRYRSIREKPLIQYIYNFLFFETQGSLAPNHDLSLLVLVWSTLFLTLPDIIALHPGLLTRYIAIYLDSERSSIYVLVH